MANPFDGAFTTTKITPIKSIKTDTDLGNIFLKSIQVLEEKPPSRTPVYKKLPAYVGGGQFLSIPGKPKELATEPRAYGTLPAKPGSERDHIIPVSLGGTSKDPNLQYLTNKKTFWETLFNKPASLKNRQEGKILVELSAINDYKAKKISLPEARARVLNWNNQPGSIYDIANKIKLEEWSQTFLEASGTALGFLAITVGKTIGGIIGTFPQMVATRGEKGLIESAKTSSDFIKNTTSEIFNEAEKRNPVLSQNVFFQFGREYTKELTGAALMTAASIPLETIGARIATKKTGIKVTPQQMGDLMTGRPPVGKPLSSQEVEIIKKEFLKPETPKAAVKEAVKTGLEIKTEAPAGPGRELAGAIIGGGPATPKTEVLVGGKPLVPKAPIVPPVTPLLKGEVESIPERVARQKEMGITPSIIDREAITPRAVAPPPIAPVKSVVPVTEVAIGAPDILSEAKKFQAEEKTMEEFFDDNLVKTINYEKGTFEGSSIKKQATKVVGTFDELSPATRQELIDSKKALDEAKGTGAENTSKAGDRYFKAQEVAIQEIGKTKSQLTDIWNEAQKAPKKVEKPAVVKPVEKPAKPVEVEEPRKAGKMIYTGQADEIAKTPLADLSEDIFVELGLTHYKTLEDYKEIKETDKLWAENTTRIDLARHYKEVQKAKVKPTAPRETRVNTPEGQNVIKEINEKAGGFITEKQIPKLIEKLGEFTVVVKDVNGQRAVMNVSDFQKLMKNAAFNDRVRAVWIPAKGAQPVEQPKIDEDFMSELKVKKLLEGEKQVFDIEELQKTYGGVEFKSDTTISREKAMEIIKTMNDPQVQSAFRDNNVKGLHIDKPYKFELSEQGNYSKSTGIIRLSADVTNSKDTILHELGHAKTESLPIEQKNELLEKAKTFQSDVVNIEGYKKNGAFDEVVAELYYKDPSFLEEVKPGMEARKIELESLPPNLRSAEETAELVDLNKFFPEEKPAEEAKPQQKFEFTRTGKNAAEKIKTEQTEIQKALSPDLPATQENLNLVNKLIDNKIEEYRKQAGYTVITEGAGRAKITIGGEKTTVFSKGKLLANLGRQKDQLRAQAERELLEFDDEFKRLREQQAVFINKIIPDIPEEPMFKRTSKADIEKVLEGKILDKDYKFINDALGVVAPVFGKLKGIQMMKFKDPKTWGAYYRDTIYLAHDIGKYLDVKGTFYHEFFHHVHQYLSDADRAMIHSERMNLKETNPELYKKIFDENKYLKRFQEHGNRIASRTWMKNALKNKFLTQKEQLEIRNQVISDDLDQEFLSWYGEAYTKKDPKIKFSERLKSFFDKIVEFLKKLINIHPSTKNFPSEKINKLIKDIIIGKPERFKYRPPKEIKPFFKLGELMPEEKEVIRLLSEGKEIPPEMQDSLQSLRRKGILQVAGETPASRAKIEKEETAALREQIRQQKVIKKLDNSVAKRLRDVFRIESWSKATTPQLEAVLSEIKGLKKGDLFITGEYIGKHLEFLKSAFEKDPRLVTQREIKALSEIPPEPAAPNEIRTQDLMAQIKEVKTDKKFDSSVAKRLKEVFGIDEWKNATKEQLTDVLNKMKSMVDGDSFMTDLQIKGLNDFIKTGFPDENPRLITKFQMETKFKEAEEIMSGALTGKIWDKLFSTVDIKEGHPIITKIVDKADIGLRDIKRIVEAGSKENDELLIAAKKSRKEPVYLTTLDGKTKFKASTNEIIFNAMSGDETIKLTPEEQAEVDWLKKELARMADERKLEKRRKYYITHLKQTFGERALNIWRQRRALLADKILTSKSLIEAIEHFRKPKQDIPIDILLALDDIIGSKKFFRFALERKGGLAPTTDIRRIYNEYRQIVETANMLDKLLPEAQAAQQLLLQPKSAIWMKQFLQNLKGRGMDWKFRQGPMGWLPKIGDRIIDVNYILLLGVNYKSALKNIIAGETNAIVWQSIGKYLTGKARLISHPKKAYKIISELGVLDGSYIDVVRGERKLLKRAGIIKDAVLYGGQQLGELEIRGSFLLGEMTAEEWRKGEITPERFREILNGIAITQGIYTKIDSPLFAQTTLGRGMLQFNRWRITNAMMLRRIIKGTYEEQQKGERAGVNTRRLGMSLALVALGMYVSYELAKAGYEKARKIALSSTELLKSTLIDLPTLQPILDAWRDNPTIQTLVRLSYDLTTLISRTTVGKILNVNVPAPYNKGLSQSYISAVQTARDINILPGIFKKSDYDKMKANVISEIKAKKLRNIFEVRDDAELVKKIKEFNKKQKELITNKLKKEKPDATKKELETEIKRYTIQPADIESWMRTKKPDQSGKAF